MIINAYPIGMVCYTPVITSTPDITFAPSKCRSKVTLQFKLQKLSEQIYFIQSKISQVCHILGLLKGVFKEKIELVPDQLIPKNDSTSFIIDSC